MDFDGAVFDGTSITRSRDRLVAGTAYGTAEWHNAVNLAAEGARFRPRTQLSTSLRPA